MIKTTPLQLAMRIAEHPGLRQRPVAGAMVRLR
jgi:hypothetical protein